MSLVVWLSPLRFVRVGSIVDHMTSLRTRYLARRTRARAVNAVVAAREASLPSRLDVLDGVVPA